MQFRVDIRCPQCGCEDIQPRARTDDYGRRYTEVACPECAHRLTHEEIIRQFLEQNVQPLDEPK